MAGTINKVIIVGNLGKDPEVNTMGQSGNKVANLSVATSEQWTDKQSGERREKTEWHRVAIFNERLIEVAERFLKKGSKVYLEGQLQTRKWQGQDGQDRYTTEIVLQRYRGELQMLDSRNGGGNGGGNGGSNGGGHGASQASQQQGNAIPATERQHTAQSPGPGGNDDLDDEIPF